MTPDADEPSRVVSVSQLDDAVLKLNSAIESIASEIAQISNKLLDSTLDADTVAHLRRKEVHLWEDLRQEKNRFHEVRILRLKLQPIQGTISICSRVYF